MHAAHPMMSVTGSLEGLVLEVLAGTTRPLSLTDVHRLGSMASMSGIRKALLRLVDNGLVDAVPGGYALNREHLAAGPIIELAGLRRELFDRVRAHVASWSPQPTLVGVYGSVARRDDDEHSDIDILVISELLPDGTTAELARQVERWTGNDCQVLALTTAELRGLLARGEPIVDSWHRDLVAIVGDRTVIETGAPERPE